MLALSSNRAAVDALEVYCLKEEFGKGASFDAARLLSNAYVKGGPNVFGDDTKKLTRLFDLWLTNTVCV